MEALTLEPLGEDRYRATNLPSEHGIVFGGQLLAQSVMAGLAGQEGKTVKTLHTVFARGAQPDTPLDITVERMHAGRSVATSTVTISQGDTDLHTLTGAAQRARGRRHPPRRERRSASNPGDVADNIRGEGAWEIGIVGNVDISDPELVGPAELDVWVRFAGAPDDPATDQALVAYSTDGFLIGTAMRPHAGVGQAQAHQTLSTGVLSHTLTYHERCPAAEWHLLEQRGRTPGTAAATAGARSSAPTANWRRRSCRTP